METENGVRVRNEELERLQAELDALRDVDPARRDARLLADIELIHLRLELLAEAGVCGEPSPYLSFLERVRGPVSTVSVAASA